MHIHIMKAAESVTVKGESLVYHHEYRIDLRKEKIPEERIMHGLKAIGEFSLLELTDMHEELE